MRCFDLVCLLLLSVCNAAVLPPALHETEVHMPKISPKEDDEYWCYAKEVPQDTQYIVQYEAIAEGDIAHHMLIYGCRQPAHTGKAWQCGEICGGNDRGSIMFAWARNAPSSQIPKDVGFEIGKKSGVNYIIIQIHYRRGFTDQDPPDESGLKFTTTTEPQKYKAGILLMVTGNIHVPPHSHNVHADISCTFNGNSPIYPFGFRVHAHVLSTVISGYQYNTSWHLIGKGNPQWPQAFYPVETHITIKPGDILGGRCTYDSDLDISTNVGSTHTDEMCNFYMMYYTDATQGRSFYECPDNMYPDYLKSLPDGNDVPLPPNPLLEEQAEGHHHHHGMSTAKQPQEGPNEEEDLVKEDVNKPLQGRYPAQPRNTDRFLRRGSFPRGIRPNWGQYSPRERYTNPYIYDYTDNSQYGGGGNNNYDFRDFYEQVKNQRSRTRRPPVAAAVASSSGREEKPLHRIRPSLDDTRPHYGPDGRPYYSHGDQPVSNQFGNSWVKPQSQVLEPSSSGFSSPLSSVVSSGSRVSTVSPVSHLGKGGDLGGGGGGKISSSDGMPSPSKFPQISGFDTSVQLVSGWPTIQPSDNLVLGQVSGMHTDAKGNLHIFHRGTRVWDQGSFDLSNKFRGSSPIAENTVISFDSDGHVLKQWGKDLFYMPHGLYIDKDDNIWVTDVALHQVMRFKPGSAEPDLTLGDKLEPGNGDSQFCKPADVIVISTGEIFVADGYCHARIAKFSKDGKFIKDWGQRSKKVEKDGFPPPSTFSVPHSLVDLEKHKAVCVADRENGRIQCFDYDGTFIKQFHPKEFGATVYAITYCPDADVLYAVNGPDPYSNDVRTSGFTVHYTTGKLLDTWMPSDQGFSMPHDLTLGNQGKDLYVGEIGPNKVWKFNVHMDKIPDANEHLPVNRPGAHPAQTVDSSSEEFTEEKIEKSEEPDFGVSIVIGSLLVIPVLVIIIIVVFLRVRKKCQFSLNSLKEYKYGRNRRFNLGEFFGRHKGFDRVNTDENDELDHLNSDSDDVEEYSATSSHKA